MLMALAAPGWDDGSGAERAQAVLGQRQGFSIAACKRQVAIETLVSIMANPKAAPAARVSAANALLDRGYGNRSTSRAKVVLLTSFACPSPVRQRTSGGHGQQADAS